MKFAKRLLMGVGAVALAAIVLTVMAPKEVHATVAALVQVVNTPTNPVPTLNTENPARAPFQAFCTTFGSGFCSWTVPAGKSMVIEFVNTQVFVPTGSANNASSLLFTTAGGTAGAFTMAPGTHVVTQFGDDGYVANASVRLYADPGTTISMQVPGGDPISAQYFNISGYTVCATATVTC
jgi:hypothetical protein